MYFNIETKRLKLRPISLKDAEFIIDLTNSKGWLNFIGNRNISTKEDAVNYIQKIINNANFYFLSVAGMTFGVLLRRMQDILAHHLSLLLCLVCLFHIIEVICSFFGFLNPYDC